MKLHIELIPKTCWGINLRTKFKKSDWDKIRKSVYEKQNICCYTCGEKCNSLDAHEMWEYDEENHIQRLSNIIGVCKSCHNAIHYGRAQKTGHEREAREQFIKVNNCEIYDFQDELLKVKDDYYRRSRIEDWELDLSYIEKQGYSVNKD